MKFTSIAGSIEHKALESIKHSAGLKITHNATMINHTAKATASFNGPMLSVKGFNKQLLPNLTNALSSFKNLQSMLSNVQSSFSSALGLGGLASQLGSLTSSFSSLTSITSQFGNISSLASSFTSFSSLGSVLGSITGDTGLLSSFSDQLSSVAGSFGQAGGSAGAMSNLATTTAMAPASTNLTNLAALPVSTISKTITSTSTHLDTISSTIDAVSVLQQLGLDRSADDSTATVFFLSTLMQDINNLLNSAAFTDAVNALSANTTSISTSATQTLADIEALLALVNELNPA